MYRSCWIIICVGPLLLWPNSLCVSATVVTSVNYIFEGFSPYATLRFFEFNDKGWNISENCIRDMYNFLEGLRRGSLWAVKLYDATAYYAGGALGGASSVRIQNPNICRSLLHQYKEQVQLASWSFLANETIVPFAVQIVMAHYLLEMIYDGGFKSEQIHQLICFPSSCNNGDLQQILEVYLFQSNHVVRNSTYLRHRALSDVYSVRNDTDWYILIGSKLASDFLQNFPSKKFQVCKQVLFVIKLTLKKALSFSPSFAFCTFAEHLLDKHFHHNVALEIPSLDYKTCNKKLTNILYVDTFYPLEQRCMPWTWFVSLEMQFFIVTCLVLLLAEIYSTYAIIIATVTFLISILASIVWESDPTTNMEEFSISTNMIYELTEFHLVFDNICLRISPYILGVCAGYILQRTHSNIKINMAVLICGWLAFLLMFGLFLFGYKYGYERLLPNISAGRWCQAILFTISHSMWSLMLFWITLTAETYQTWTPLSILLTGRYLHVLERLSPACLLVAPIVIRLLVFSGETAIYSSAGQTLSIFVGCLIASYLCAFLLHVLFDGPLCAILQEAVLN
ncbi:uncharacterized protein [Eurosta solidaginis]|uniref:uncharacterized protein isoform X2 n=1 Tax=Eurosta solidaginis TaxID=178769 RepID=UPI003530E736